MEQDEFIRWMGEFGLRRLPSDELLAELEHVRYELAELAAKGGTEGQYCDFLKRVLIKGSAEIKRRRKLAKYGAPEVPSESPITGEFIAALKAKVDSAEVISRLTGQIGKCQGKRTAFCCPFHAEVNPSLIVYPDGRWYCFGCAAGGDIITFIQQIRNVTFRQALQILCDCEGLPLPEPRRKTGARRKCRSKAKGMWDGITATIS